MKCVYLNVKGGKTAEVREIKDDLQEFYKLIDCGCIDIVDRKIGHKRFDIICDDEGLFTDSPKISAIDNLGEPMLVGNLIIVGTPDGESEELKGLTDKEAEYVLERIQKMYTRKYPEGYYMLTQCEY